MSHTQRLPTFSTKKMPQSQNTDWGFLSHRFLTLPGLLPVQELRRGTPRARHRRRAHDGVLPPVRPLLHHLHLLRKNFLSLKTLQHCSDGHVSFDCRQDAAAENIEAPARTRPLFTSFSPFFPSSSSFPIRKLVND